MKPTMIAGILLVVVGVFMLAYPAFRYKEVDRVFEAGPIKVDAEKTKTVPIPPILGGLALAGGVALLVMGSRKA